MINNSMKISDNYKNYIAGKEPLENAIHVDPTDKVVNLIKNSTNHRFWTNDYTSFKKGLLRDIKPVRVEESSLSLIPNNDNLINRIYESESSELFFEERLSHVKLDIDNVPIEMYDRSNDLHDPTWDATVKYSARLESSTFNVSKIIFKIISVKLNVSIIKSTADNEDGSESDIEDEVDEFEVTLTGELSDPKIEVLYAPYVLDNLTINCYKTTDVSKWKITEVSFGRPSRNWNE